MRINLSPVRRAIAICLCAALLLPFCPLRAMADDGPKVIIEIGQPSVWSLGQAHYLLAKMHRRDRKLSTRFPDDNDLDSNRISATRIDALRQSIGIEGQFDQAMGTQNNLALQRFREGEVRREAARTDLLARQGELQKVNTDLADINEQIAVLTEQDRQSKEERDRATPPAPPTAADNERKLELVRLGVKKTRKEEERTELKSQITSLTTTADTPTAAPTLQEPALTTPAGTLPNPATFQKFMDKALAEAGKPELSASMKLDNFVNMQYEIISKQLTLLRDEVGPDDRVIFLELPASIYTVDGKANDYVAQIEWKVKRYCDKEPPAEIQEQIIRRVLEKEGRSYEEIEKTMSRIDKVREAMMKRRSVELLSQDADAQATIGQEMIRMTQAGASANEKQERRQSLQKSYMRLSDVKAKQELEELYGKGSAPYPVTLEMIKEYAKRPEGRCSDASTEQVRAIDIIPRQSALNVNEYHATVNETKILAAFKWLIGFAVKVDFQRQRELYEQFVQQQVFASGYGKGSDKFGWTYGPQPGTKRIAPGLRTTFAVLVVPRNTLAVELSARGRYYKRNRSPLDTDKDDVRPSFPATQDFLLSVPGKRTQEFWVDGLSYAPVRKGKRITAIIEGNYFSPQLGIMVNGVPLEPVVSISRAAGSDEETDVLQSADSVVGEYEITNSRQIILSFTMGESYVGTPNITFTSPEKTTSINFFDLNINHRGTLTSLQEQSVREPMFIGDFNVKEKIEDVALNKVCPALAAPPAGVNYLSLARLRGDGFRPGAEVSINDAIEVDNGNLGLRSMADVCRQIQAEPARQFIVQEATNSYIIYADGLGEVERKLRYRQPTRQGYDEREFSEDRTKPAVKNSVRNYRFNPAFGRGEVDLTFSSTVEGMTIAEIALDDPEAGRCLPFKREGSKARVKCFVPADNGGKLERDFITVKVMLKDGNGVLTAKYEDIRLPVRPMVTSVVNPRTGYAAGFAEEEPTVIIAGVNLQGIKGVFFGDKEAKVSGTASPDAIAVKVPKGVGVPKGQAVAVPIIFQTGGGQVPSGAVYTYLGEPLQPNVIVWPPPVSGKP